MKKKLISAVLAAVIALAPMALPDTGALPSLTVTAEAAAAVKTPTASLKSGTYSVSSLKKVTLSCGTKGAVIYYSVNGGSYKKYTKPLTLSKNTTLKFYAKSGSSKSKTVTRTYKFTPKVTITPNGGEVDGSVTVKAKSSLSGVKLYYTLDGSKPTKKSPEFPKAGIKVDSSCKLRVLALKTGFTAKYYSAEFTSSTTLTVGRSKSILNDYTKKYYYNQLDDRQKQIYRDIWDGVSADKTSFPITPKNVTESEFDYVWRLFNYENPQFFALDHISYYYNYRTVGDTNYIYELHPQYYITTSAEKKRIGGLIDKAAEDIIDRALKEKSDYEVLLSIYSSVNAATEYLCTDKHPECSIIGPLVNGKAQCEGYSMAVMYLCQSVGIPCIFITGEADGSHGWNKVNINGNWCQLDATWDDMGDYSSFGYFCLSDEQIAADHTTESWFPLSGAAAVTEDYNYFTYFFTVYDSVDKAYNALLEQTVANYAKGIYSTTIYCRADLVDAVCDRVYNDIVSDCEKNGLSFSDSYYTWRTYPAAGEIRFDVVI
ncbi:MAG: chitobiase/beta-hexosaminidase C-terminal domain-containing protein [Oscillospiraceae bacterium]